MKHQKACKLLLLGSALFCLGEGVSQDLSTFEIMENNAMGLSPAPFAKRGECLVDIDRDGWADIYILKYNGEGYSRLYRNQQGRFTDISHQTPFAAIENRAGVRTFNGVWADYDNDGDRDFAFGTNDNVYLLRNDNNVFTDVGQQMGFVGKKPGGFIVEWHYSIIGWADYDLDGDLDCAAFQINNPNLYLFRNDGDHFTDVAAEVGLNGTKLSIDSFINPITWNDWDMDGDPDLAGRKDFYANENGIFREVTAEIGLAEVAWTNHKDFFDYDNDGDLDYLNITGSTTEGENQLWENRDNHFYNVSVESGLSLVRDRFRGVAPGDFDNDGDQDVFVQLNIDASMDVLLVNDETAPGVRAFSNVAEFVGLTKMGDRIGGGFFDYNNDGFLDIYIPSAEFNHILYRNTAANNANWIGFRLEGTKSNRDAVGSFVTLYQGGKKQLRYFKAGSDYLRQDNPFVHFGIGFATSIDSVVIRWPLGAKQTLTGLEIKKYHDIKEPEQTAVSKPDGWLGAPELFDLMQNYPNPFNPSTTISFSLLRQSRVRLTIHDVAGKEVQTLIDDTPGKGVHTTRWNGCDAAGNPLPAGVYFYRLQCQDGCQIRKMLLVR